MEPEIKIFPSPLSLAEEFASEFVRIINKSAKKSIPFTVALSGGSTPELLFSLLGDKYSENADWSNAHFFWCDERCVPPGDSKSNFGMANDKFISKTEIPSANIHRITGESNPAMEALRYSSEIEAFTRKRDGFPVFDLMLLGVGDDGHTSSVFPGHTDSFASGKICEVAVHPATGQKRITVTGTVINNADNVIFLVTGKKKALIVRDIISRNKNSGKFPAAFVNPAYGHLRWYLDEEAASYL